MVRIVLGQGHLAQFCRADEKAETRFRSQTGSRDAAKTCSASPVSTFTSFRTECAAARPIIVCIIPPDAQRVDGRKIPALTTRTTGSTRLNEMEFSADWIEGVSTRRQTQFGLQLRRKYPIVKLG